MDYKPRRVRIFQTDLETIRIFLSRARIHISRFFWVASNRFDEDMLNLRAMGLTFTTLLSLVPFLAVTVSVLKAFGVQNELEPFLAQALKPLGAGGVEITSRMISFVNSLRVGVLGALGLAFLFVTVISLISKIEDSLNYIWRIRHSRSVDRMFSDYLSVVLVGPILVFVAFALTASAQSHWLVQRFLQSETLGIFVGTVTQVIMPFIFLCAAFSFIYRFIPYTYVRTSSAMFGGIIAGVLWQLAGVLFTVFVATMVRNDAIYSSFVIIVIFLIWVYVGWLVVLVGAEVAYFHQHSNAYHQEGIRGAHSQGFREELALMVLVHMTRRYLHGEPPWWPVNLAETLGVPLTSLDDLVDEFVERGLVLRTTQPEGIVLGRPPEQVPVVEVLDILRGADLDDPMNEGLASVAEVLQRRDQATRDVLDGVTLRSLATDSTPPAGQLTASVTNIVSK